MTKLSVNINKIATLRNARGGNTPDVLKIALDIESFGADGITVHPRPDERHIKYTDVYELSQNVTTEFNIEGYPNDKFLAMVKEVKPHQVTLVPDPPHVLTSNDGWNTINKLNFLIPIIDDLKSKGIRVSIFVEPKIEIIEGAKKTGADRIELYTEYYAVNYTNNSDLAVKNYVESAKVAKDLGLGINAGHDLSLENLKFLKDHIPFLDEVSIGHALISDALYYGLENTVMMYKKLLN